jgi:trehalose/maltose transport system substrate-binding protein
MLKKIFIFFTFIILSFSAVQCGGNRKQFTIWIGGSPEEINYWAKLIKQFNDSTGYDLQLVRQPTYTDQRRQSLAISLQAKQDNPDLFLMDVVWIDQFAESHWLQPLNKYVEKTNFPVNVFFPGVINSVDRYNGKLYALPVFLDVAFLYYRTDLLKKYGYNQPPKTWKELLTEAEKIQSAERKTSPDFNGFVWQGAQYEGLVCDFLEYIASAGGGIMQKGQIKLNTPQNLKGLKFMRDLIHKYKISPPNTYTEMKEEPVRRDFQRGNALFERNWTYAWKLHQSSDSQVKGKTGMTILPHFQGDSSVSTLGGWHIGISKYSDEKQKAWKFIQFITSYKSQENLFENVGWNPGREDVYFDKKLQEEKPQIKTLYKVFKQTVARPTLPYYSQVSDVIQRYVNNCLAGKTAPKKALAEMQKEINKITKVYGRK